jgi:hypothetical protein
MASKHVSLLLSTPHRLKLMKDGKLEQKFGASIQFAAARAALIN